MSEPVDSERRPRHETVAMSPASPLVAEALRHERERVIGRLTEAFAGEQLELDELERRLTLAHRAGGSAELAPLVGDLDPAAAAALGAAARSHGASVAAPPG